jgi:hypothetical protein
MPCNSSSSRLGSERHHLRSADPLRPPPLPVYSEAHVAAKAVRRLIARSRSVHPSLITHHLPNPPVHKICVIQLTLFGKATVFVHNFGRHPQPGDGKKMPARVHAKSRRRLGTQGLACRSKKFKVEATERKATLPTCAATDRRRAVKIR